MEFLVRKEKTGNAAKKKKKEEQIQKEICEYTWGCQADCHVTFMQRAGKSRMKVRWNVLKW
jgi:hypothetical protein